MCDKVFSLKQIDIFDSINFDFENFSNPRKNIFWYHIWLTRRRFYNLCSLYQLSFLHSRYLKQFCGSDLQSVLHLYLCHDNQPIGGVSAKPLFKDSAKGIYKNQSRTADLILELLLTWNSRSRKYLNKYSL